MSGTPARASLDSEAAQLDQLTIHQRLAHELNERKRDIPTILDALTEKAKRGDGPAARELRGWYDQGLGKPEGASVSTGDVDTPWEDMTPEERAVVRGRVIAEIARLEAEEASGQASDAEHGG